MHTSRISNLTSQQKAYLRFKLKLEKERRRRLKERAEAAPAAWQDWLKTLFPRTFTKPFAERHVDLWEWLEGIQPDTLPKPAAYVDVEPRGGGKTTTAETAVIRVGAKETRKFVLYVRSTQAKANESIQSVSEKLESKAISNHYPLLARRKVGKYGNSKGWRMDLLRCANDFNALGYGLDVAARGVKFDDYRPDLIILDDIDEEHDSLLTIKKKIDLITGAILPAGATHCAYLIAQNLIHANSIVNQLVEGTAEFLLNRQVSGPHKAVDDLTVELQPDRTYKITGGTATWAGQPLAICEHQINTWGLSKFMRESQHEVEESGGIWDHVEFFHITFDALPDLVRGEVWVDPAVTATDDSDSMGISAGGLAEDQTIYIMYAWEQITSPLDAIKRAILKAIELGFRFVGVESDQGGDTWKSVYYQAWHEILEKDDYPHIIDRQTAVEQEIVEEDDGRTQAYLLKDGEWQPLKRPLFRSAKAGAGHGSKVHRNQQMLADYERGRVVHVIGTHKTAERALRRFPQKPLDYADAQYWLWFHLNRARKGSRIL